MQETSKGKLNIRDLGTKCREDAEKRETGQKENVKKQNHYSRQKKQMQLTEKSEKILGKDESMQIQSEILKEEFEKIEGPENK